MVLWLEDFGISVVEIGVGKAVTRATSNYIDLTGRRNLLDLAYVVHNAKIFVGVDSGFSHMANAFQIPSIILLGRYTFFDTYFPYSGGFAHSDNFKCVRAPLGQYTKSIPIEQVKETLMSLLKNNFQGLNSLNESGI